MSTQTQTPSVSRSTRFNHQENTNLAPTLVKIQFSYNEFSTRHVIKISHGYVFSRSKLFLLVARTKRELLQSALIFRLLPLLRLRRRGDTITIIIITITGTTDIMMYLPRVLDSIITRRILADPAIVPSRIVEPRWSRLVIVCWIHRTDSIIIVRPPKRRRVPHNLPPGNTIVVLWRPGVTKAELWRV